MDLSNKNREKIKRERESVRKEAFPAGKKSFPPTRLGRGRKGTGRRGNYPYSAEMRIVPGGKKANFNQEATKSTGKRRSSSKKRKLWIL